MPKTPSWKQRPPTEKEAIRSLKEIEQSIAELSRKVFELRNHFEFPILLAEIEKALK